MSEPEAKEFVLRVNGREHVVELHPGTSLLSALRNDLGLRAAKYGCGLEQCGSCTVLVGGVATHSCGLSVGRLAGREVITLEGLAEDDQLHPLQEAFLEEQAAQCAYCVPGVIMSLAGLLAWNDDPSNAEICSALEDNLCRCGAHPRILRAARRAAASMRGADSPKEGK